MESRNERLKKALEVAKVTQEKLAQKLGVTRATVSERLLKDQDIDSIDFVKAVSDLTGSDFNDLMFGTGILAQESSVTYMQGKIIRPVTVVVDRNDKELISYVPVKAQAGYLKGFEDPQYLQKMDAFSLPILKSTRSYRMFEVEGESMLQLGGGGLHDGDVVISQYVEDFYTIRDNRVYVVIARDGVFVKRLLNRLKEKDPVLICKSDNKNGQHTDKVLRAKDIVEVWELKAFISRQLSFGTDIWSMLSDVETKVALMNERIEKIEIQRLNP